MKVDGYMVEVELTDDLLHIHGTNKVSRAALSDPQIVNQAGEEAHGAGGNVKDWVAGVRERYGDGDVELGTEEIAVWS